MNSKGQPFKTRLSPSKLKAKQWSTRMTTTTSSRRSLTLPRASAKNKAKKAKNKGCCHDQEQPSDVGDLWNSHRSNLLNRLLDKKQSSDSCGQLFHGTGGCTESPLQPRRSEARSFEVTEKPWLSSKSASAEGAGPAEVLTILQLLKKASTKQRLKKRAFEDELAGLPMANKKATLKSSVSAADLSSTMTNTDPESNVKFRQMAPPDGSGLVSATSNGRTPNKALPARKETSVEKPTATESWMAVAQTDALQHVEAEVEASFNNATAVASTASKQPHSSLINEEVKENGGSAIVHHHHHHHHHYHYHHHSQGSHSQGSLTDHPGGLHKTSSIESKEVTGTKSPSSVGSSTLIVSSPNEATSGSITSGEKPPKSVKSPLKSLLLNENVLRRSQSQKKHLSRSNTTLEATSNKIINRLTGNTSAVNTGNTTNSQPASPRTKSFHPVKPAEDVGSSPNSESPSTPTSSFHLLTRKMSGRRKENTSKIKAPPPNNGDHAPQPPATQQQQAFDMEQMQKSLDNIQHARKGSSRKSKRDSEESNGKAPSINAITTSSNSVSTPPMTKKGSSKDLVKKEKYKSLWGKVGKHGMQQAAATASESSGSGSSTGGSRPMQPPQTAARGWDQVLNPLLQKQRATYYSYHAQQVQMGAAVAGSGWAADSNMECDCGEDSCPRCNLLLSMDETY